MLAKVTKVQNVFKNVLWIKILTDYQFKNEREIQEIQRNIALFLRVHCWSLHIIPSVLIKRKGPQLCWCMFERKFCYLGFHTC